MKRLLAAMVFVVACATALSCNVNEYCLNCATGDGDGGPGDGGDGDGGPDDGGDGDAGDGGQCVPSGAEVCDNKDNDCNGQVDEGALPGIGDNCDNQVGECAGAVKQCVAGAVTCTKSPVPETCDLKDNDCNGLTDEGDPGGGAKCGTDVGECVAGNFRCNTATGTVECVGAIGTVGGQAEQCNGRDDDCDNNFDEGLGSLGSCPGTTDVGECVAGTLMCIGGGVQCVGDQGPQFEACDTLDNDCDTRFDEDTNKLTDPQNCGACNNVCNLPNAIEGCAGGTCTIAACQQSFHNNNNQAADGCEFGPCTIQGNEVCNGVDDDCNPATSETTLTPPPGLCLTIGACAGATASCDGANGFRCSYNANVQQDANGNVLQETRCDGIDNDCDGAIDEGQPNLGDACNDGQNGECRGTGTFQCDSVDNTRPAVCVITTPGQAQTAESCDAKDNDCDTRVDEGANTGDLAGQEWVTIPNVTPPKEIMKYEASRPGATGTNVGTNQAFACSKPGVQPWTNITHPQAEAACASIGATLCSEDEWQRMCDPAPAYPIAGPGATGFVFVEAETPFASTTASGDTWQFRTPGPGEQLQDFSGTGVMRALPDNGTSISGPSAPANSPRLDFQFNLLANTTYVVWVRAMGITSSSDAIHIGLNATAPGTVNAGSFLIAPLNTWVWVKSNAITTGGTAGNHVASLYMSEDGVRVDAIAITRQTGTTPPPFDERTWAYQNNPKTPQAQVCNGDDFDTSGAAGDQDDILATGARPACFANGPTVNDAFDMSGNVKEWALQRAAGQNPLRGGASNNETDGLTCGLNFTLADDAFFFPNVGFRCCRLK